LKLTYLTKSTPLFSALLNEFIQIAESFVQAVSRNSANCPAKNVIFDEVQNFQEIFF